VINASYVVAFICYICNNAYRLGYVRTIDNRHLMYQSKTQCNMCGKSLQHTRTHRSFCKLINCCMSSHIITKDCFSSAINRADTCGSGMIIFGNYQNWMLKHARILMYNVLTTNRKYVNNKRKCRSVSTTANCRQTLKESRT